MYSQCNLIEKPPIEGILKAAVLLYEMISSCYVYHLSKCFTVDGTYPRNYCFMLKLVNNTFCLLCK